ncbi:MAG: RHS repeat-associated core domain-containing protein [Fimbriiglobus sp.]
MLVSNSESVTGWPAEFFLRKRSYDPSAGRFTSMDPYAGSLMQPNTLHRFLYTPSDPINNLDPSGEMSLGALSASIGNQLALAGNVIRGVSTVMRTVDFVSSIVQVVSLFTGGLPQIVDEARKLAQSWAATFASGIAAPQTRRLLDADFYEDAASVLATQSPRILAELLGKHATELISKFAQQKAKPFHWVVYMPTPAEEGFFNPTFWLPLPFKAFGNTPVLLRFGGGGTKKDGDNRGRLFGFGYVLDTEYKKGTTHERQFFRMDYHDSHGGVSGNDKIWPAKGSKYEYHFHIRP